MNNSIPFNHSEHVISDDEFESLVTEVTKYARKYHDYHSLPSVMRKVLSDALKRDKRDGNSEGRHTPS